VIQAKFNQPDVKRLDASLARFSQFRTKFLNQLPRVTLGWVHQRIRTRLLLDKKGPDGESWPAWAEGYQGQGSLLYGKRNLVNSFRMAFRSGAGQLGTPSVYAAIHHFGGLAGRKSSPVYIPKRPYFGIGKPDIAPLEHLIQQWVNRNLPP
jgi:phage virion morphogenesis protein